MKTLTAYIEWDPETKLYVGVVPGIPGAHTQGASLDELHQNLEEVTALCLGESPATNEEPPCLQCRPTTFSHGREKIRAFFSLPLQ